MAIIKELADAADMIVSGYAFTRLPDGYRVINLNRLESVALFSKDGDVIETSMCDIETTIALKYFEKNRSLTRFSATTVSSGGEHMVCC